jgi:Flp pilus assembly protein TadG
MRRTRITKGAALTETAAGLIFLIPVVLFLIDAGALVMCQISNDALAKHAARAAAELPTGTGTGAAANVVANFAAGNTTLCKNATLVSCNYLGNVVTVETRITCQLPCPIPLGGPSSQVFDAKDAEPVVGDPP